MPSLRKNPTLTSIWEKRIIRFKANCKVWYQIYRNSRQQNKEKTSSLQLFPRNCWTRSNIGRCFSPIWNVWLNRKIPGGLPLHIYGLRINRKWQNIHNVWICWEFKSQKYTGLKCAWGVGTFSKNSFHCDAKNLVNGSCWMCVYSADFGNVFFISYRSSWGKAGNPYRRW